MPTHTRPKQKLAPAVAACIAIIVTVAVAFGVTGQSKGSAVTSPVTTTVAPVITIPARTSPEPFGPLNGSTLTSQFADTYSHAAQANGYTVTADQANGGTNTRRLYAPASAPTSVDQTSCVTWNGTVDQWVQPGVAVRYNESGGRVRAVTVTNNVWANARWLWNVHVWDTNIDSEVPGVSPGTMTIPVMGETVGGQPAPPWRMCARVAGTTLDFKVWPAQDPEPAWGDPHFTGTVELPADAVFPGQPGFYIGHLAPGETSTITDITYIDADLP